jgi:DNA-binding IclR family transcriptional regulator
VLQALQKRGYIYELAPRGGFYPTLRLHELAKVIADHDPVLLRAEILLRSLRDILDESVQLAKVRDLQATYLLCFESAHALRIVVRVGDTLRSVHATSAGKALLASFDDRALAAFLKSAKLTALTDKTVMSKTELRSQIETGRKRGWFVNREESVEGVTTLSSTFKWQESLYIVTVAGPTSRIDAKMSWAAELLMDVCKRLETTSEAKPPKANPALVRPVLRQ